MNKIVAMSVEIHDISEREQLLFSIDETEIDGLWIDDLKHEIFFSIITFMIFYFAHRQSAYKTHMFLRSS